MDAITSNTEQSCSNPADSICKFQEIGKLPVIIWAHKLEYGETLGEFLLQNKTKYHKSCKLKSRKNIWGRQ